MLPGCSRRRGGDDLDAVDTAQASYQTGTAPISQTSSVDRAIACPHPSPRGGAGRPGRARKGRSPPRKSSQRPTPPFGDKGERNQAKRRSAR